MYSTVPDVFRVLPSVGSLTTVNSDTIVAFINEADAVINARLGKLYTVPVSDCPVVTVISTEIAAYRMLTRRILTQEQVKNSVWPDRFKEALEMLKEIASGDLPLVTSSGALIEATGLGGGEAWSNTQDYVPTFAEDGFAASGIDEDKLEDIDR